MCSVYVNHNPNVWDNMSQRESPMHNAHNVHTYAAFPLNQEVVTALSQWTAQPAVAKISSISVLHFLSRATCFLSSTFRQQKRIWQKGRWAAWWIMQNIIHIAPYNKFDYLKLLRSFDTHFAVGLWIVVVGGFQDLKGFFWIFRLSLLEIQFWSFEIVEKLWYTFCSWVVVNILLEIFMVPRWNLITWNWWGALTHILQLDSGSESWADSKICKDFFGNLYCPIRNTSLIILNCWVAVIHICSWIVARSRGRIPRCLYGP